MFYLLLKRKKDLSSHFEKTCGNPSDNSVDDLLGKTYPIRPLSNASNCSMNYPMDSSFNYRSLKSLTHNFTGPMFTYYINIY